MSMYLYYDESYIQKSIFPKTGVGKGGVVV